MSFQQTLNPLLIKHYPLLHLTPWSNMLKIKYSKKLLSKMFFFGQWLHKLYDLVLSSSQAMADKRKERGGNNANNYVNQYVSFPFWYIYIYTHNIYIYIYIYIYLVFWHIVRSKFSILIKPNRNKIQHWKRNITENQFWLNPVMFNINKIVIHAFKIFFCNFFNMRLTILGTLSILGKPLLPQMFKSRSHYQF